MPPAMLGRVFAADTALATLGEGISAVYAGFLLDYLHLSANDVTFVQAIVTSVLLLIWAVYHAQDRTPFERKTSSTIELTDNQE
jgi:uncharacterized MnhB-related membrane protein